MVGRNPIVGFPKAMEKLIKIRIGGAVQGVGFRPFVYRLAREMGVTGWVRNSQAGVEIEAGGGQRILSAFVERLMNEKPALAAIREFSYTITTGEAPPAFEIRPSRNFAEAAVSVPPDVATCPDCLLELFDSANRRYRYPFINCSRCGPRYSILENTPFDRPNISTKAFPMCPECGAEYTDPVSRRFHAAPITCPQCGPRLELWTPHGQTVAMHEEALMVAADTIRQGGIVAMKGIGGFQLLADARNEWAVRRLRKNKRRPDKPFAIMAPSLATAASIGDLSVLEAELLSSPAAPIVLVDKSITTPFLAHNIAPGTGRVGLLLPYSPVHHLLMTEVGFPIVVTSGSRGDAPMATDPISALSSLAGLADCFLVDDWPIVRVVDDSIAQVVAGQLQLLRRARGYAPLYLPVHGARGDTMILAVGAQDKNGIAVAARGQIIGFEHVNDPRSKFGESSYLRAIEDCAALFDVFPHRVACDLHPDYASTAYAWQSGLPVTAVQHHHAHVLSCMADHGLTGSVLGVAWDGSGFGSDGIIWGGEFLHTDLKQFRRVAHFRPFRLPGGEEAVDQPARTALGLIHATLGDGLFGTDWPEKLGFKGKQLAIIREMLGSGTDSPWTTSVGKLFDGIAAITGCITQITYEGQAAMRLEALAEKEELNTYPFSIEKGEPAVIDWRPMLRAIMAGVAASVPIATIAAVFHNTLIAILVSIARKAGEKDIVLTGDCFQNRVLSEKAIERLYAAGFTPHWHNRVPPNDGGIAVGQLMAAIADSSAVQ